MTRCVFCKHGHLKPGKANFMGERGDVILVVRNVPARICDNCGEEYFDEEVSGKLLQQIDAAGSSDEKVVVRDYTAA